MKKILATASPVAVLILLLLPAGGTAASQPNVAAVAFSHPRENDPIAGTRIRVVNAISVTSPAPAKISTSADIDFILPQVDDDHHDR